MANVKSEDPSRIPPQSIEAEQSLLGAVLLSKDAIIQVTDMVSPADFYRDVHGIIFEAMQDLFAKQEPIDVLSLSNKLEERGKIKKIGGRAYLASLSNNVPSASNVNHYAKIVQRKATLRRLIDAGIEITTLGFEEDEDLDVALDKAEQRLMTVTQRYMQHLFRPMKSLLTEAFDRIDELHRQGGKLRGIPTGYKDLDDKLAGFQKSDLVILAARPSMGKTSLALDLARHVAVRGKTPVGIFSLEMSKEQLVDRILCSEAGVDLWKMRTGRLTDKGEDDDFTRIGQAMGVLAEAPIYIDDAASANVMDIRARARRLQMEKGLGLLIVDYLQLIEGRGNTDSRVQEISEISRSLKALARELQIPVLALSQLSRAVEARSPAIPKLADLRESGAIEQDADVVMFIYRKAMDKSIRDLPLEERNIAEIYIEKHRNGPTGKVELYFDEGRVSFQNLQRQETSTAGPTF
ncbi:replicative DNA helicase [Candidatus Uhrbacteria bacterium CG10_big_fil_rev_8_21_14_0_10_48_11]|uniref:Replicative DNA helicase n=1 Tax=Candidatus Uhrbacteria bacterium CG10_big_fil_rev_8_21_14_0_10_48_11 TaxID=1975037 RepID=A0A2M8LFM1_9BACT|nr:MAG: replicative DNA helicase [Candidatus Uhrbacteria bacterium CG10_big_fil_rev_8_21_14_0_10_48_11]